MNGAHLHLLVNHVPLFSVTFGLIAFVWSWIRRSDEMRRASMVLFLLAAVSSWLATETGESAEKIVEHLADITKTLIHPHEEAAELAFAIAGALAAASLALEAAIRFKHSLIKSAQILILILALASSLLMARVAYYGGQIRHSEVR
ncbi:hypothetical protein WDW37_09220 [Bdellovibrionota bacterium FG-1]